MGARRSPELSGKPLNANDRWKSRWRKWLVQSTLAAAVAHLVVFVAWPAWEIRKRVAEAPIELIQINPVAAYGGLTEPSDGVIAALPTLEEAKAALEEARQGDDETVEEPAETFGVRMSNLSRAVLPDVVSVAEENLGLLRTTLTLELLQTVTPDVTQMGLSLSWPQIRNPTMIMRFLRSRYNPLRQELGTTGMVTIAVWVDDRGRVERARVSESSGYIDLDQIALRMFEQVVAFAPARNGRSAVPVQVTYSIPFGSPW